MKRVIFRLLFALLMAVCSAKLAAQDTASNAALIAERREMEERMKALQAVQSDMQQLLAKQVVLEKRIADLQEEMRVQKAEDARDAGKYLTRDDLKRIDTDLRKLSDSIKEVDKRRESGDKALEDAITQVQVAVKELGKTLHVAMKLQAVQVTKPEKTESSKPDADASDKPPEKIKAFTHKVAQGETLSAIIAAYNAKLKEEGVTKRITLESVLKANSKLKPERMQIGQEILLPDPRD